ncbi:MAG TPA: nucleoid-associated protein [Paludibacter sp.]
MIDTINCNIRNLILHKIGNKLENDSICFSHSVLNIDDAETRISLLKYFTTPFIKSPEYLNFYHDIDIMMNEVFVCVSRIFDNPENLLAQSVNLAKHLYEQSTHPKIKSGEFYVVYFKDCIFDGKTVDAVGLFKSENKDTFLKVYSSGDSFEIESQQGVNINKLDKGCLVFNTEKENGYVVAVVDNTNKGAEAQYWMDNFLHVRPRKDEYYDTQNLLSLCKNFATKELPQQFEVSKADQVNLLNKSVQFFKENESFSMAEFTSEVIAQPAMIDSFNEYRTDFQRERDIAISDSFNISESAVKKQARSIKSIIKLDKNFHIYVHGSRELIVQGVDEKGKFYKVYYQEES